ncbi:hypothetical protein B0A64_18970 [Flavobacterium araucananum]|uniref:Uncharacterized protein n=1 Tax=Flavobacterium araucananum TaxID=946678 RepID=A0A227NVR0_9FLAO|nr:hypothetical protein B0A64_18970 [Flavobacterium araucananum]
MVSVIEDKFNLHFKRKKRKKRKQSTIGRLGIGSAISPEGVTRRGTRFVIMRTFLPMPNKLACFLFFFEEFFKVF